MSQDSRYYAPPGLDPYVIANAVAVLFGARSHEDWSEDSIYFKDGAAFTTDDSGSLGLTGVNWVNKSSRLFSWMHSTSFFKGSPYGLMFSFPGMNPEKVAIVHRLADTFGGVAQFNDCEPESVAWHNFSVFGSLDNDAEYARIVAALHGLRKLTKKDRDDSEQLHAFRLKVNR